MNVAFLDFEATGLGPDSKPIEFACCDDHGVFEAFFIQPEPSWTHWDPAAEALHGISKAEIARFGRDARQASDRVFTVLLRTDAIYSDHHLQDADWLAELMHVGGHPVRGFRIEDVADLYWHECHRVFRRDGQQAVLDLIEEADIAEKARTVTRHRAGPDARSLWWKWQKIIRLVQLTGA